MIFSSKKSIFISNANIIVNPVNIDGIMGKGLAKEFKDRFPNHFIQYKRLCNDNELTIGNPKLIFDQRLIYLFPTKIHWKDNSQLDWIDQGLEFIKNNWNSTYKSISFPKLGCGLGGLNWNDVKCLFVKHFADVNYDVIIHLR